MAWIEAHDDIWEHHKTIRLCKELGILDVQAVGHLLSLWHFVLRNAWRDANLEAWGDDMIEVAARWRGTPGSFLDALRKVGLMDGYIVHGWAERAGRLVYDRTRKEAERKSAEQRRTSGGKSKATVPYSTVPNPTQQKESTAPYSSLFCTYNDRGQGSCTEPVVKGSRFCAGHKLKVRDKFLDKQQKNTAQALPSLKDFQ